MDFDVLTGKSLIRRNGLDKVFCLQKMRSLMANVVALAEIKRMKKQK